MCVTLNASSDIKTRQKQLSNLEIPLHGQRRPSMVESDVAATAEVHQLRLRWYFKIHLEYFLDGLEPLPIRRIRRDVAAAGCSQSLCRQLFTGARNDPLDDRGNCLPEALRKPDINSVGTIPHHIDDVLRYDRAHRDVLQLDDVCQKFALVYKPSRQILWRRHDESSVRSASNCKLLDLFANSSQAAFVLLQFVNRDLSFDRI